MGSACGACDRYNEKIDILTEKISTYEQLDEAVKRGHKFAVLEDAVIDISPIMSTHPGGSEILRKFVGTCF